MKIPDISKLKKKKTVIVVVAAIVVVVILLIMGIGSSIPSIATFDTEAGEFIMDIRSEGEMQAASSVTVSVPRRSRGGVRIASLAEDGVIVKEGDFLVQFDTSEAENRVQDRQDAFDNAEAELTTTQANIESTMKQLENSYLTQQFSYEQAKLRLELMKFEAEIKKREQELEFKKAELSLEQAKEKIESQKVINAANLSKAELRVKQAQKRLDEAQEMLDALTLTAPKSGMVVLQKIWTPNGREKVKIGDTPHRGMDIINIPDLSTMLVKTTVNEIDISRVAVGQQTVITLDALPGPAFYGKITSVATLARSEEGSDMKVFDVEVTIDGSDERLKPGMSAQCKIITGTAPDVLYIPLEAVFEREDTTVVYIKGRGFDRQVVRVGKKNSDYIIIEEGLSEGDRVALRDPSQQMEELGVATSQEQNNKPNNQKRSGSLPL